MAIHALRLRAGVADRLLWTGPRDPVSFVCSNCRRAIDPREVPLRLMGSRYAVFCDACVESCFEMVITTDAASLRRGRQ